LKFQFCDLVLVEGTGLQLHPAEAQQEGEQEK
jgi:hypothetical protein